MSAAHGIVDCEHHVVLDDLQRLVPYLDAAWEHRMTRSEFRLPPAGPHPGLEIEAREVVGDDPAVAAAALSDGCTMALLVPSQPLTSSGWLSHELAQVFATAVNDYVVDAWLPVDERFRLAISVQSHDADMAAAEIRRLGGLPRTAAVAMSLVRVNMGQRHYHPIYAAAEELGLPILVHPGGFEGSVVGPAELGGVGPYTAEEAFSLVPQVAMANLASLVFDGVFERFPRLRVVFAGFGFTWAVSLLWRADAEWRNLRVEVPWLTRSPSAYVAEHVRFIVDGAAEVAADGGWELASLLPEGVLVHGSDRPFARRDTARMLEGAPAQLVPAIQSENAQALFA